MDNGVKPRHAGPRLNHKKSRGGCQRCKARKVKCDEVRPACGGCSRHTVACVYATPPGSSTTISPITVSSQSLSPPIITPASALSSPNGVRGASSDPSADTSLDIPESRDRRMLELRLWHTYIVGLSQVSLGQRQQIFDIWNIHIPLIALRHDNLLYTLYAIAATSLLRSDPEDPELLTAHQTYLSLAMREQRAAVSQLETMQASVADAVCFASLMMTMDAFGALQERGRDPYTPPVDMLRLGMGAFAVFRIALQTAKTFDSSKIVTFVEGPPRFHHNIMDFFDEAHRKPFLALLGSRTRGGGYEDEELWDPEVSTAYEMTLSYVGTLLQAVENEEPLFSLCRRIMSFTLLVPKKFVDMVEELRPRALVILAYFFALSSKAGTHWWVGKTPVREVQGLLKIVPHDWQHHMRWPIAVAGLEAVRDDGDNTVMKNPQ